MPSTAQDYPQQRSAQALPERRPVDVVLVEPTTVHGLQANSEHEFKDRSVNQDESGFPVSLDLQAERQRQLSQMSGGQSMPVEASETLGHNHSLFEAPHGEVPMDQLRGEVPEQALDLDELDASHPLSNNNPENHINQSSEEVSEAAVSSVGEEARQYAEYLEETQRRLVIQEHQAKVAQATEQADSLDEGVLAEVDQPSGLRELARVISLGRADEASIGNQFMQERQAGMVVGTDEVS